MKLQYSILNKRYTEIMAEHRQTTNELTKMLETVQEQKKIIKELKKELLELGYLVSVKVEKINEE